MVAQGFALYENDNVVITVGQPLRLNVAMTIQVEEQKVQVSDTAPTVDVNPANNAGTIIISGKELDALPDDPDELLTDCRRWLGLLPAPTADSSTSTVSLRVSFLPSPRFAKFALTRIHSRRNATSWATAASKSSPSLEPTNTTASFRVSGNDSPFNSTDPFAGAEPGYYTVQYEGSVGGPINKNASFFVSAQRRNINDLSAIDAQSLDQNLSPVSDPGVRPHASPSH